MFFLATDSRADLGRLDFRQLQLALGLYINLPMGTPRRDDRERFHRRSAPPETGEASSIDYIGFGFLALWLATLQFVLDQGQELDWFGSHTIAWCVTISAAAFVAFVVGELTAGQPFVVSRASGDTISSLC